MTAVAHPPVLIMAGGTGGHIFPGLAVARELADSDVPVVWLGSATGMECSVVPAAGLQLETLDIRSVRGGGGMRLLKAPFLILRAVWQALQVLRRYQPRSVLSMGGFASGPGGLAAWLTRRPLVVHEQNQVPGMTNKVLARLAARVLTGFPDTLQPAGRYVGNPVRRDIFHEQSAALEEPATGRAMRLLIVGGSQGAAALNSHVPQALLAMPKAHRPEVIHQTGRAQLDQVRAEYRDSELSVTVEPFIEDMASAYRWADLVVCRAGALTLAELAAAGLGAILVPYPFAVDDHQTLNARFFSSYGAAILAPESELSGNSLATLLEELSLNRSRLATMAAAARELAKPEAAARVATACIEVART